MHYRDGSSLVRPGVTGNGLPDETMPLSRFRAAIEFADSYKSRPDVNKYLARGCGCSIEDVLIMEARGVQVQIESFKKNLRNGLLKKSNPPTERMPKNN